MNGLICKLTATSYNLLRKDSPISDQRMNGQKLRRANLNITPSGGQRDQSTQSGQH